MLQMRKRFLDICAEELDNVAGAEVIEQTEAEVKYLEEEAIKQEMNIAQDLAAIEELTEDINVIQDQLGENDKKLTDPDIVVTAVDVEVSEECYKALAYKHGIRNINAIRFSSESVLDSVKAEPRRYLSMSSEGLKDIFIKIWEKIKAFFRAIGEKLGIGQKAKEAKMKKALKEVEDIIDEALKMTQEEMNKALKTAVEEAEKNNNVSTEDSGGGKRFSYITQYPLATIIIGSNIPNVVKEITDTNNAINVCKQYANYLVELKGMVLKNKSEAEMETLADKIETMRLPYANLSKFLSKNRDLIESDSSYSTDEIISALAEEKLVSFFGNKGACIEIKDVNKSESLKFVASEKAKDLKFIATKLNSHTTFKDCVKILEEIKRTQVSNLSAATNNVLKIIGDVEKTSFDNVESKDAIELVKLMSLVLKNGLLPITNSVWSLNNIIVQIIKDYKSLVQKSN